MLRITQYGSRLFGIDASSDPAKFQDDWPSGIPLIGAWSMTWHQCKKIVKNWHQPVKLTFFGPKFSLTISGRPNGFNRSMSMFLVNFKKIGESQIFALSRDRLKIAALSRDRLKIAVFKSCSDSPNMGRICSVLMPVVTLQSFKMIGRLEVR